MKPEEPLNHRTRVAAERREKTRAKLLESALLVFAQKGPQAVIDDVIAQAGMARGSFYNYFRTNEELLVALAAEINDELMLVIDPAVQLLEDPAERIARGTRLMLHAVLKYPLFGAFMVRLPFPTANSSLLAVRFMSRDIAQGVKAGRFGSVGQRVATDLVAGVVLKAAHSLASEPMEPDYPEAVVHAILVALGIDGSEAARIIAQPLPELVLPAGSILVRAQEYQA
ncbi:TetR/AcrR family transcriptional regulator [Massilia niastensis]|uniref:TetR/AcrR family transcriptional regulator n=1 Tax=Massilia niastensis TaxID=544911 RepID=UPI00036944F2|nr:TetR/AcrR family transcriptional regulator [Massilia niastensis]